MNLSVLQWLALVGMLGIGLLFATELSRWRSISVIVNPRQKILRVSLVVLIEALLAMMFVSPRFTGQHNPAVALIYWTVCVFIGFVILVMAWFDFRETLKGYARAQWRLYEHLQGDDRREP